MKSCNQGSDILYSCRVLLLQQIMYLKEVQSPEEWARMKNIISQLEIIANRLEKIEAMRWVDIGVVRLKDLRFLMDDGKFIVARDWLEDIIKSLEEEDA